jgi:RNA polymerase sigma factor (sigma-70 family)
VAKLRPVDSPRPEQSRWFTDEVTPHAGALRAYLRDAYPAVRDIDDVVQESLLRVWRAQLVRPVRSAKSFLFQVARHLAVDFIRHERASPIVPVADLAALPVLDERPGAVEAAFTRDDLALLARALHRLPPRCRQIMILRKIDGLPQKEIAARLGLSEFTVQVQIVAGLRRLREFFAAQSDVP